MQFAVPTLLVVPRTGVPVQQLAAGSRLRALLIAFQATNYELDTLYI